MSYCMSLTDRAVSILRIYLTTTNYSCKLITIIRIFVTEDCLQLQKLYCILIFDLFSLFSQVTYSVLHLTSTSGRMLRAKLHCFARYCGVMLHGSSSYSPSGPTLPYVCPMARYTAYASITHQPYYNHYMVIVSVAFHKSRSSQRNHLIGAFS